MEIALFNLISWSPCLIPIAGVLNTEGGGAGIFAGELDLDRVLMGDVLAEVSAVPGTALEAVMEMAGGACLSK